MNEQACNEALKENAPDEPAPIEAASDDENTLHEIYDRVTALALRKARAMVQSGVDDSPEFDRGARTLGTLMRTAFLARQMKEQDTEERRPNDGDDENPDITDDEIRAFKRSVEEKLDRIEAEERSAAGDRNGDRRLAQETHAL